MRLAEHPAPERVLVHLSDTHLRAEGSRLFGSVDAAARIEQALDAIAASGLRPDALVFTGDLADFGEADAYDDLRALVEPLAHAIGARVFWVMGNHDDRSTLRRRLLDDTHPSDAPYDRVDELDGLRLITLDTSVPGRHHGEVTDAQLQWLADVLSTPAPLGSILALHHPPVPSVLPLAAAVELRDQPSLAHVLRGSDVRAILAGHLHYSTFATFAGIPVSVASSTCYAQDLTVPVGGTRPHDASHAFNLVHVYDDTVVHSVVPVASPGPLEVIDPDEVRRRLLAAGVAERAAAVSVRRDPPTAPLPVLR